MNAATHLPPPPDWQVVCLCAAWCGTCREWEGPFLAAARAQPRAAFHWIDIEDQADRVGDVDVETFPTLLVAHQGRVRFFGPVMPSAAQLTRLLDRLAGDAGAGAPVAAEAPGLLARLAPLLLQKP